MLISKTKKNQLFFQYFPALSLKTNLLLVVVTIILIVFLTFYSKNLPGLINVDFADLKTIMINGGQSLMSVGFGDGKDAAMQAIESALSNPLINKTIDQANGILFYIKGGNDISLGQIHEVANKIKTITQYNPKVMFGVVREKNMKNKVNITLIATGIEKANYKIDTKIIDLKSNSLNYNINNELNNLTKNIPINI